MNAKLLTDLERLEESYRRRTAAAYALALTKSVDGASQWAEEIRRFGDWFTEDLERVRRENLT